MITDGHVGYFCILAIGNAAIMKKRVQISLWYIGLLSFQYGHRSRILGHTEVPFSVLSFWGGANPVSQWLQYVLITGVSSLSPAFVDFHQNGSLSEGRQFILILICISHVIWDASVSCVYRPRLKSPFEKCLLRFPCLFLSGSLAFLMLRSSKYLDILDTISFQMYGSHVVSLIL